MAEDQEIVFSNCELGKDKKVDCLGQLPYKHPSGEYNQPKTVFYGNSFNELLHKKMFRTHDEC